MPDDARDERTILLAHGPNLSQLGSRDPAVYGTDTLDDLAAAVTSVHPSVDRFQSEHEGDLVARLHRARVDGTAGVILNPGALTHYSYALRDAIELLECPVVEVHLSQTHAREPFRRHSVVSPVVDVTITGAGTLGYELAARACRARLAAPAGASAAAPAADAADAADAAADA